jgi:hypothetical protein
MKKLDYTPVIESLSKVRRSYRNHLKQAGTLVESGDVLNGCEVLHVIPPTPLTRFVLRCKCGKLFVAWASNVISGRTKGCGCGRGKWKRSKTIILKHDTK